MTENIKNILHRIQKIEGCFLEAGVDTSVVSLALTALPEDLIALYQETNGFHAKYTIFYRFDAVVEAEDGCLMIGESTTGTQYIFDRDTDSYLEKDTATGDVFAEYNNLHDFLAYLLDLTPSA